MISLNETMKKIICEQGRKQSWVIERMNEVNPNLNLNPSKFSAIMSGIRSVSADELLAFCQVTGVSPDVFAPTGTDPAEEVGA